MLKLCLNIHFISYSILAILEVSQNRNCLLTSSSNLLKNLVKFVLHFIFLIQFLSL